MALSTDASHAFGPHRVHASEVFAETPLSLGFVNLKPVVPGHVLFVPRRVVHRLADLRRDELHDLWSLVHACAPALEQHFGATASTFAVQDGAAAGQTVPHVHVHVLPRKAGDFERNDEVYDGIDDSERKLSRDLDKERVARSPSEMATEAAELRTVCASRVALLLHTS
jgi:bis(5'-adenosyl)-triphosphatase